MIAGSAIADLIAQLHLPRRHIGDNVIIALRPRNLDFANFHAETIHIQALTNAWQMAHWEIQYGKPARRIETGNPAREHRIGRNN